MEIINDPPRCNRGKNDLRWGTFKVKNLYVGIVLILAGVLWILKNLYVINRGTSDFIFSWQMLLMVLGGYFFVLRNWVVGGVLFATGALFMASEYLHLCLNMRDVMLPLMVIVAGVMYIFWRR